jgi:hypothetical protein
MEIPLEKVLNPHKCGDNEPRLFCDDTCFICDLRPGSDPLGKPVRKIPPTKVKIVSNNDLPKGKKIYYSDIHFRPINANKTVSSRVIPPYDNTGHRSYTGVGVRVFLTMEACEQQYLEFAKEMKSHIDNYARRQAEKAKKLSLDYAAVISEYE